MKILSGNALMDHMQSNHGFHWIFKPKPNSREYKRTQKEHEELYHGRWQDQQDHTHGEEE
jgi:hypothetical protein